MSNHSSAAVNSIRDNICARLQIDDFQHVEIESKKRVRPKQAHKLIEHLSHLKKVEHIKSSSFFDQFVDTPKMDLFKRGASLRLRYKRNGSKVYLQYKGPGFLKEGLLYRSEFSSKRLTHVMLEESHHDMIHFSNTSVRQILRRHVEPSMAKAMRSQLGSKIISQLTMGPIICSYEKEKFLVDFGSAFLEPSVDRVYAFFIRKSGLHPLSMFWEYENEIKASHMSLNAKITHVDELIKFDKKLSKKFDLKHEKLDKYHRCTSIFLAHGRRR